MLFTGNSLCEENKIYSMEVFYYGKNAMHLMLAIVPTNFQKYFSFLEFSDGDESIWSGT